MKRELARKKEIPRIRELSGTSKAIVAVVSVAVILWAAVYMLTQAGLVGGPDSLSGYYMLQVNAPSEAPQGQPSQDTVFVFDRLALNSDRTFRLGGLRGNWKRSGSTVSLTPTVLPKPDQFYGQTSMAQALSIMLKPSEFTVSADEKTLTALNPTNGPVVFKKTNEVFR